MNVGLARQAYENLQKRELNKLDEIKVEPAQDDFVPNMPVWSIDFVNTTDGSLIKTMPFVC